MSRPGSEGRMGNWVITDRYHFYKRSGACGPAITSLVDIGCIPPGSYAVTGVRSWIGRGCRRICVTVCGCPGGVMVEFVRFTLDDGSEVLFESAESDLVALRGGAPEVRDGGKLTARLQGVAEAAEEVAGSLRARLVPDEVSLEFGLKVSGGVNWFFAKAQGEGTIKVTLKWAGNSGSDPFSGTGQDPGKG